MKDKVWLLLGIASTGGGAYLLSVDSDLLKVLGALITTSGAYLIYKISSKNSTTDKNEIIYKIDAFKDELESIKSSSAELKTRERIDAIENEFDEWAKEFKRDVKTKKLDFQNRNLEIEAKKINLSKNFLKYYIEFFDTIINLIKAYNKNNNHTIEFLQNPSLPINLYSKEAYEFRMIIKFNEQFYWHLFLNIQEPVDSDDLPSIVLTIKNNAKPDTKSFDNLIKSCSVYLYSENTFIVTKAEFYAKSNFKNDYPLKTENIRSVAKEIFQYQLLLLDN